MKTKMKTLLLLFLLMMIFLSSSVIAGILVDEDFDDGAFNPPYEYICGIPEPPGCNNTATYVTNIKRAGAYSLECVYIQLGAAGIKITPADYSLDDFGTIANIRWYFKHHTDFRFHNKVKLIRWHSTGNDPYINTNGCGPNGYIQDGPEDGSPYGDICIFHVDSGGFVYVANTMAGKGEDPADWVVTAGDDWWMIEARINTQAHTVDLWVQRPEDDIPTQVFDDLFQAGLDSGDLATVDFNWLNFTDAGSGGKMWIDEIVISDQYIGPLGSGSSTGSVLSGITLTGITFK